jgi:hypothetical protein
MERSTKFNLMAAATLGMGTAMSPAVSAQNLDQPVRIGVMDLQAKALAFDDPKTSIEYQAFTPEGAKEGKQQTRSGEDHGIIVASAVVRQYRTLDSNSRIELYAANPFGIAKNSKGKSFLKVDFKQAEKALEWMHSKGVRVVVTAFNSSNQLGSFNFMNKAEKLGMTVFAAYSNDTGKGAVYPAADARAISVVDTNKGSMGSAMISGVGREKDAYSVGITFAMNGGVPQGRSGNDYDTGSSFSSAKAAAYGAYVLHHNPQATRDQIVGLMKEGARPFEVEADGQKASLDLIGEAKGDALFLAAAASIKARPEGEIDVAVLQTMMNEGRGR